MKYDTFHFSYMQDTLQLNATLLTSQCVFNVVGGPTEEQAGRSCGCNMTSIPSKSESEQAYLTDVFCWIEDRLVFLFF